MKALISIVTFNSAAEIGRCLRSLKGLEGFCPGENLEVCVIDNDSRDSTREILDTFSDFSLQKVYMDYNSGFCAGHNRSAKLFLESEASYLLVLNPDAWLTPPSLSRMIAAISDDADVGIATPKLLRTNQALEPLVPAVIDAAGMYITPSLRHFDRGSGVLDTNQFNEDEYVFGGTGACLLLKRELVEDLCLPAHLDEPELFALYPDLRSDKSARIQLFDEAFFAYREDAELCWRAQRQRWRCRYVAAALAYHRRVVTPERRSTIDPNINSMGVRNRFLLQLNHAGFETGVPAIICGVLIRNLLVLIAVVFTERRSLKALREVMLLRSRALRIRRIVSEKQREARRTSPSRRWFGFSPVAERIGNE